MATNLSIDPKLIEEALELSASAARKPPSRARSRNSSHADARSDCWN
jgi:hypothetical protein